MPKAVLFIIAKIKWNNRKGPPTGEWVSKFWYSHI